MSLKPVALVAMLAALLLAGCGSGDDGGDTSPATAGATTSAAEPESTAGDVSTGGGGGEGSCEVPAEVKDAASDSHVTGVEINGGCQMVSIGTTWTKTDYQAAQALCESVSKVAYEVRDDLMSVNVEGPDGHELAIGLKGAPCIGEP